MNALINFFLQVSEQVTDLFRFNFDTIESLIGFFHSLWADRHPLLLCPWTLILDLYYFLSGCPVQECNPSNVENHRRLIFLWSCFCHCPLSIWTLLYICISYFFCRNDWTFRKSYILTCCVNTDIEIFQCLKCIYIKTNAIIHEHSI